MLGFEGEHPEAFFKTMTGAHEIPRADAPKEVAYATLFAVECDDFAGAIIDVDGG
ncbi:MAG: hypothetical protein KKB37_05500 [Alphaproteobacteria bacterium]|nr:hypothetical protein [Alphaproteobacteria bacterium]